MAENFTRPVTAYLYDDYVKFMDCIHSIENLQDYQLLIFGAGARGCIFGRLLLDHGYTKFAFVDNSEEKWGGYIFDASHPIHPPSYLEDQQENKKVIVSITQAFLVEEQLQDLGYVLGKNLFCVVSDIYEKYVEEFFAKKEEEILLLGDCFFTYISFFDRDYRSLGSMLEQSLDSKGKVLGLHALDMEPTFHILKLYFSLGNRPQKIVLKLGPDFFTKMRQHLPKVYHLPLFEKLCQNAKTCNHALEEYLKFLEKSAGEIPICASDFNINLVTTTVKQVIKMNYMYPLGETVEDAVFLRKIIALCKEHQIELIALFPPVNYEYARTIHDDFDEKYNENQKTLTNWITDEGFEVIDLSYLLSANEFSEPTGTNEILNQKGRDKVAEAVYSKLK